MMNKICIIALALFMATLAACSSDSTECDEYIYLSVMGGVGALPNNYVLDASYMGYGAKLDGDAGIMMIEKNKVDWSSDFGRYIEDNTEKGNVCGLRLYYGVDSGVNIYLITDGVSFVFLSTRNDKEYDLFSRALCATRDDNA